MQEGNAYSTYTLQTQTTFDDSAFSSAGSLVWNYLASADGPQTAGLVILPFKTVAGEFLFS